MIVWIISIGFGLYTDLKGLGQKQFFIEYYIQFNKEINGFELIIWNIVFKSNDMYFIKFIKYFESDSDRFHIEIDIWSE